MAAWSTHTIRRWLAGFAWAAAAASPFATHVAISTGRFTGPAVVLAVLQAAALAGMSLRQDLAWQRLLGVAAAMGLLLILALRWPLGAARAGLVADAGLSHALIYGSLLVLFARSLRPGWTPIVTALASRFRGVLTPEVERYTRIVTKAWCVFFTCQLCVSALLWLLAPVALWSLYINVLDAPMVVALFLAEFAVRRWRFRHHPHVSPLAVARAFARGGADG